MSNILFPSNTKQIIDDIRGAIGRLVTFYVPSGVVCSTCGINPVTGDAIDAFCPECHGIGKVYTYSGVTISGHISWGYSEQLGWVTGGQLDEGKCRVQIEYTTENMDTVTSAEYLSVDDRELVKKTTLLRGVPEINRIILDLEERNK